MHTKIVYFDYAAVILLVTILLNSVFKKIARGKANKFFCIVNVEVLLTAIIGSITINLDLLGPGHLTGKLIFHTLYLLFHNFTAFCYLFYLISLTDTWHRILAKRLQMFLILFPEILQIILMIINLFVPFLFYFDSNTVYTRTNAFALLYVFAAYYLLYGVIYIFYYKHLFSKKMLITVFLIFPTTVVAVILEAIFPYIVIEPYANAIALLLVSTNIQHREEIINIATGFGNNSAFESEVIKTIDNKKNIMMIMINVINYHSIRSMLGYERKPKLATILAKKISEIDKEIELHSDLYYLKNGQFRMLIEKKYFDKVSEAAEEINNYLTEVLEIENFKINLMGNVCIVRIPDEISNYDTIMNFGNDLSDAKYYTQKVMYASNIFKNDYYTKIHDINDIIEKGFTEGNFKIYYQPIYSIKDKKFNSAEALLRLNDKKYGFISPEIFIPAAEKSGSIHRIGTFVLEEVCKFIISDDFKKLGLDYIEVNLSVAQCMQENLSSVILGILGKYGVSPDKINLEVTETSIALSEDIFMNNLQNLVNSGLNISLDDFGSGYSNFKRIVNIPLEIVKLDKSFVNNNTIDKFDVILKNIINMIRELNIKIVVEGIEKKEDLDKFIDMNCDYIQGFYFSKPVPLEEFKKIILSSDLESKL